MTKLIGGNISDTPIKDISDGSAFSVGGGGDWWQSRLSQIDGDSMWDNVEFLFQAHPDDVLASAVQTSVSPDRKDPSAEWTINRYAVTSSSPTSTYYCEFVNAPEFPLGAAFQRSNASCLSLIGGTDVTTGLNLEQDWTLEVVFGRINNAANIVVNMETIHLGNSAGGYKFGHYNAMSGATGTQYWYKSGQSFTTTLGDPDSNGDYSSLYNGKNLGVQNFTVFYDHSALYAIGAINGVLWQNRFGPFSWSGFPYSTSTHWNIMGNITLSDPTETRLINGRVAAARFTWGDRYSLSGKMTNYGMPAQFTPDFIFPEKGT